MWSCNYTIFFSTSDFQHTSRLWLLTQEPGVNFDVEILPLSCSQDFYYLSILTLMGINCNYTFFLSESLDRRLLFSNQSQHYWSSWLVQFSDKKPGSVCEDFFSLQDNKTVAGLGKVCSYLGEDQGTMLLSVTALLSAPCPAHPPVNINPLEWWRATPMCRKLDDSK